MKENVSGYSRNPCSLNRERDAAFAAKLLTLPTGFFSAEKSEEWMARSPVWPDDVIASETASRHQPMNWRDSIWAQTRSRGRRSRCVKLATQRLIPYSENKGYASNPRRFSAILLIVYVFLCVLGSASDALNMILAVIFLSILVVIILIPLKVLWKHCWDKCIKHGKYQWPVVRYNSHHKCNVFTCDSMCGGTCDSMCGGTMRKSAVNMNLFYQFYQFFFILWNN